jgi:hypothetical protein
VLEDRRVDAYAVRDVARDGDRLEPAVLAERRDELVPDQPGELLLPHRARPRLEPGLAWGDVACLDKYAELRHRAKIISLVPTLNFSEAVQANLNRVSADVDLYPSARMLAAASVVTCAGTMQFIRPILCPTVPA